MQGAPSGGVAIKIEFVAGTWTDVTADFDSTQNIVITWGQASEFATPSAVSLSLMLDNVLGKYTPQRQVLADGVTANPFYPNVAIRKRIWVTYTTATATYTRFKGYIKSWQPVLVDGEVAKCAISAASRDDKLNLFKLSAPLMTAVQLDSPSAFFPLTDASGSTAAYDPNTAGYLSVPATFASGDALSFGATGVDVTGGNGTAVTFAPVYDPAGGTWSGQLLMTSTLAVDLATGFTVEAWINASDVPVLSTGANILGVDDAGNAAKIVFQMTHAGKPVYTDAGGTVTGPTSVADGQWHHLLVTAATAGGTGTFYVDGVSVGTCTTFTPGASPVTYLTLGEQAYKPSGVALETYTTGYFAGSVGYVAIYNNGLTATQVQNHFQAGDGWVGDTTGQRIARYLGAAGLTSSDWNLATGICVVGSYPSGGVGVVDACRAMAVSEGAGSSFYFGQDGLAHFVDRKYRGPSTPLITVDQAAVVDGSNYTPSLDDASLINLSVVTLQSGTTSLGTFTAQDAVSVAALGPIPDGVDSYATSTTDALYLAQSHVADQSTAILRLQSVTLDMYTSSTAGLYDLLPLIGVGSRLRVTNLPKWAPASQLDVFVEGGTETINVDSYSVQFATSQADNPPRGVWGVPAFARWQAVSSTLHAAITAVATTVVIDTASGPVFTTDPTAYPLQIQVEEEVMTLTSGPSGGTSPQTFTGVARGQAGTPPAPQVVGAAVNVYPQATWTL